MQKHVIWDKGFMTGIQSYVQLKKVGYLLVCGLLAVLFISVISARPTHAAVSSLSTGTSHACVVKDGKVKCWGNNTSGQLGNDSRTDSATPVSLYTRAAYTETVRECDGWELFGNCIGAGWRDKTVNHAASPLYGRSITKVSAGQYHTCAIADARAYCWGNGGNGRLGNGSGADAARPVAASTASSLRSKELVDISAGDGFTCALASDGTVHCWGDNTYGQLGNGTRNGSATPVAVSTSPGSALQGAKVMQLALLKGSAATMCAITTNDKTVCWGQNYAGQAGDGKHASDVDCQRTRPALFTGHDALRPSEVAVGKNRSIIVSAKTDSVKQMSVGYSYVTALADNNRAYWWGGATTADTCGRGSNTNAQQQNCHQAGGAGQGGCGSTEYERIYTYQGHCLNQEKVLLAPMACTKRSSPGPVSGPLYTSEAASQLQNRTLSTISGSLFTGSNLSENPSCTTTKTVSLLLTRSETLCPSPVPADMACAIPSANQSSIFCDDGSETCNTTGTVVGDNILKATGNWRCTVNGPQQVSAGGDSWLRPGVAVTAMDTGFGGFTCAVANDTVGCWGTGGKGQLGNGSARDSRVPVRVAL